MDKLFVYNAEEMLKKLKLIEPEMQEDSYSFENDLEDISKNAIAYIKNIFAHMKRTWRPEECTVLALMKELYRVAYTGEYSYMQSLDDISYKSEVFQHLSGESGYKEVLYACKLLRYYYLVYEKNIHDKVWKEIEQIHQKTCELKILKKIEKKDKNDKKEITGEEFLVACREHLDKYYIGQEVLKKKLCSVLYQYIYHNVRTIFLMIGPTGSGKNYMIETLRTFPELDLPVVSYDCSSLTPNGFNGADVKDIFKKAKGVIRKRKLQSWKERENEINRDTEKCIIYLDEIDKIINTNHDSHGENVNAMIQQQLLAALAGTEIIEEVDTSKVLFILGGAFPRIDELKRNKERNPLGFNAAAECKLDIKDSIRDQIIDIGGEAEFVGRIEDIVKLSKHTREDLKTILMHEHIGAFTKKKKIYIDSGLDLEIDEDTVDSIVDMVVEQDAGARGVKNVMNQFADNQYFYNMKVNGYSVMKIHKGMLQGEAPIFIKGDECNERLAKHA